jgi:hypothetical protein
MILRHMNNGEFLMRSLIITMYVTTCLEGRVASIIIWICPNLLARPLMGSILASSLVFPPEQSPWRVTRFCPFLAILGDF